MYIFLYMFLIVLTVVSHGQYQLKQVHIIYRHGDRAPTSIYPTSNNNANQWPRGLGQLTVEGINQQFQLGQWLRNRYSAIVGPILNNSDIHVRSTDVDRTLMSAESNLAGFVFSEPKHAISGLPWNPVPIHTVRDNQDYLLEFNICPLYKKERKNLYDTDYFKKKFAPYQPLLNYLRQKTGLNDLEFMSLWQVYDQIFCEKAHNITVDDWVTKEIWDDLLVLNKFNWELMFYNDLAKLTGGLLLYTITKHMWHLSLNEEVDKAGTKLMVYSGHDTDVAPMAKLLGFYDDVQPAYTSCIILELYYTDYTNGTDQWAVKVLYKNVTESVGTGDIYVRQVRGCDHEMCALSQFIAVTKKNTMTKDEFMKECGLAGSGIRIYVEVAFVVVSVGLFFVILIMFFVRSQRSRTRGARYSRFGDDKDIN